MLGWKGILQQKDVYYVYSIIIIYFASCNLTEDL